MKLRLGRIPAHYFIFFSSLAVFLFSLQRNFSAAHDSITYLNHISEGNNLFHPHHLLYNFTARGWLLIGRLLMPAGSDYIIIEMLSALFGSALLTICYLFFRRRASLSATLSSLATVVIAFSYGVWSYSTNIEVYAMPTFFSILVLYTITNPVLGDRKLVEAGLYTTLAILFHQVHVLLLAVAIFYLARRLPRDRQTSIVTRYFAPVMLLTGIIYLFVAFQFESVQNISEFLSWATLYAHGHDYWRSPSITSLFLAATGFVRSLFGGQFLFRFSFSSDSSGKLFQGHNLADEQYLVRDLHQWQAVLLTVVMLIGLFTILSLLIQWVRHRWYTNELLRPIQYTFIVYSCFFLLWMPENLEFWILQSVLFWMLLFSPTAGESKQARIKAGIIAASLFIVNYGGSIFWLLDKKNDWYYSAVQPLIPTATNADLVISKDPWIMNDYV
ncbi:MAG TPA: hypothetical protein VLC28_04635, partial [Flavitalea sp.]|nr:hypothetical protein [Flavitalea sp.]